ncbi:MAG: serine hydrolase domain-containing protein, partial [Gemmatimonadota bacterium]
DSAYGARVIAEPTHRWSRAEQVKWAMDRGAPYGKPGEVYHYSDTGYILLGEIVERVSRMPLASAFRTLLNYDKLGLTNTWMETLEPIPAGTGERAHQYQGDIDSYGFDPSLDLWGGGGNDATVKDMAVFTRALFTGGVYDKKTTIDTMLTLAPARDNKGYRFGISPVVIDSVQGYGHTGYWNTFSYYYPDIDVAIAGAVTQNHEYKLAKALNVAALSVVKRAAP